MHRASPEIRLARNAIAIGIQLRPVAGLADMHWRCVRCACGRTIRVVSTILYLQRLGRSLARYDAMFAPKDTDDDNHGGREKPAT